MIKSFSDTLTKKIFYGETLIKKERKQASDLNLVKAQEALKILDIAAEKQLLLLPSLAYHKLEGTNRYSIDASGRKSKWRITFSRENQDMIDVQCVKIENTH